MPTFLVRLLCAAALLAAAATDSLAAEPGPLPIFDTHVHYSEPAWTQYPVPDVLERLRAAGVRWALVSSSPDEGTVRLADADPDGMIPFLRPYRGAVGSGNWLRDAALFDYLEARLAARAYAGIGEFHLHAVGVEDHAVLARLARLAAARGLFLHVHSGAAPVEALYALEPGVSILWAHAGMSEGPETVGALLDRHPTLMTEVSFRAGDIAPGGTLAPAWAAVLRRHAERIMIGSDTYVSGRWAGYGELIEAHRAWLAQLPAEVAAKIAWQNAVRAFKPRRARP